MRFIYSKSFAILAGCLVLVALLVVLQARGWLSPLQNAVAQAPRPVIAATSAVIRPVRDFFSTIYRLNRITKENAELSGKLRQAQINRVEFEQLRKENDSLRAELGFARQSKLKLVPCAVIAQNSFGFTDSIILDCGTQQGVRDGMAVVSQGFLAGKVDFAQKSSSSAVLATASRFSTDARITQTNAAGIARGSFNTGLVLDQLSQNSEVQKKWMVVTAGISESVPKNIPIGEVGETLSSTNDLFKKTTLISPVDFNNLDFVFVVSQ